MLRSAILAGIVAPYLFILYKKKKMTASHLRPFLTFIALCCLGATGFTQSDRLDVFIDCRCDMTYIRQEVSYVNHVRDQAMADVQVFVNDIQNGSGGSSYEMNFVGKKELKDLRKKLAYETQPTMTNDEIREGLVQKLNVGLLLYLAESGRTDQILVSVSDRNTPEKIVTPADDPWKNWIFEVYGEAGLDQETSRSDMDLEFGFDSDRITEDWRIRARVEFNHSEDRFESDEESFVSIRQRHFFFGSIVRSLSDHWSAGAFSGVRHDTYTNIDLSYYLRPAIEYNLFPYREVIRREITFAYMVGIIQNNYLEETIYGETREQLFNQSFNIQARFRQPWGDIYANLEASSFLHDLSKNSLELYSRASVRVFKGLAVRLSLNLDLVRDQINLPAGSASLEDVLLRQRQIATDFEAGFSAGVSYTFGSAFNNIINTRL